MSMNKYRPHLFIIPEDEADRQIADGFLLHHAVKHQQVRVMQPSGGWNRVLDTFKEEYVRLLCENANTNVVLLVDFDGNPEDRHVRIQSEIPMDLRPRVFVIGPRDTPESLRRSLGIGYEAIGRALADDCDGNTTDVWGHDQLSHNEDNRLRLVEAVRPFLFSQRGCR